MRIDKDGGDGKTLASGLAGPVSIAVDDSGVYVAESGDDGAIVRVVHEGGGGETRLVTHQPGPHGIVLTDTEVFWIDDGAFDVAKGATVGGAIMRVSKAGGAAQQVVAADGATALLVDGGFAYYSVADAIMRAPLAGGAGAVVAAKQHEPRSLAVDATHVYWTTLGTPEHGYADGDVRRLPK